MALSARPRHRHYDVVIVGGAVMGSSCAWWLSRDPDFDGRILVIERDPSYAFASTTGSNSCIRHQYSNPINVRMGLFGTEFIKGFRDFLGDPEAPEIRMAETGYLYLLDGRLDAVFREQQAVQAHLGAATRLLSPDEIAERWPFYRLDGITMGSWNPVGEGWFDGATMFETLRRQARANGVEYLTEEAVAMDVDGRITGVHLASGETVGCGTLINAAGPRAAEVAAMAGVTIPVEPRKRCLFRFRAQDPLDRPLPFTITPSGVHCRSDHDHYVCGAVPEDDPRPEHGDNAVSWTEFEDQAWPTLAAVIPAFEAIKVTNAWACHYEMNLLDANAVIGPHPRITNLLFCNGFSGHGLQQSPAAGRAIAELVVHGAFRTLDLAPLGYARIERGEPFLEKAVI